MSVSAVIVCMVFGCALLHKAVRFCQMRREHNRSMSVPRSSGQFQVNLSVVTHLLYYSLDRCFDRRTLAIAKTVRASAGAVGIWVKQLIFSFHVNFQLGYILAVVIGNIEIPYPLSDDRVVGLANICHIFQDSIQEDLK